MEADFVAEVVGTGLAVEVVNGAGVEAEDSVDGGVKDWTANDVLDDAAPEVDPAGES